MKTSLPSTGPGRSVRKAYNVDPRIGPRAFPIHKEYQALINFIEISVCRMFSYNFEF